MYIERTIETTILEINSFFPVILLTGPRQVGKTTVFQHSEKTKRNYVSLDNLANRELAQNDPVLFLQRFPAPLLIDEIQYAPQLFPHIKEIVDREQKSGSYWLTGSQQFQLMQNVSESLAGRVGILKLQGLSQKEKENKAVISPFLPTKQYIEEQANISMPTNIHKVFHNIWKGSYPKLYQANDKNWEIFYSSYIQTYLEKDIRDLALVSNELNFMKFMKSLAARIGQLVNYADLAKDIGVSQPTIKSWVSIMQSTGLIYLLPPYSNNLTNRVIKTPKIYFMDTGLVAHLTGWKTPETIELGAMNEAFLENYIVSEIIKSYWHNGQKENMFFYRDKDMKEIDILFEENGKLYPVEIKMKSNPNKKDISAFNVLEKFGKEIGEGAVICFAPTYLPITEKVNSIPVAYL